MSANRHSDYDDWVADPDNLGHHIAGILRILTADLDSAPRSAEPSAASRAASLRLRAPFLIDPATGHTPRTQLCWVCGTVPVYTGAHLPRLRACRFCLAFDRSRAARLGLGMLLPLFDWPSQPVLNGASFPSSPAVVAALADVWSGVSVLDEWRVSLAQVALSWMNVDPQIGVDLHDWQQQLTVGPSRSQACWRSYVDGHFPALARVLASSPVPAERIMR